jgi:hypothetical protein
MAMVSTRSLFILEFVSANALHCCSRDAKAAARQLERAFGENKPLSTKVLGALAVLGGEHSTSG